jgi:hypothetical protein
LDPGTVQDTETLAFAAVAVTPVGAEGVVLGVTGREATEGAPTPVAFTAATLKT